VRQPHLYIANCSRRAIRSPIRNTNHEPLTTNHRLDEGAGFLAGDAAAGRVGQGGGEGGGFVLGDFHGEGHVSGELAVRDGAAVVGDEAFHRADQGVGDSRLEDRERRIDGDIRSFQAQGGRMAVSPDETAGTELDAAKVTGDDDSRIGQALLLEDFQDGPSCRAGRFAVIAGPLETAVGADLVGRAVVAGIPVFLFHFVDEGRCFIFGLHFADRRDEAGFLDDIFSVSPAIDRAD